MALSRWFKIISIAFGVALLGAVLHGALPSSDSSVLPPSMIVQQGLLPIVYIIYVFVWFSSIGFVFSIIDVHLYGGKISKGIFFGSIFSAITIVLYFEPLPHVISLISEVPWMLVDGFIFLLLGSLLGKFVATDNPVRRKENMNLASLPFLVIMPFIFLVGRVISYSIFGIYSVFPSMPFNSLLWALVLGFVLAISFFFFRKKFNKTTPFASALLFGIIIFGIYYFFFNFVLALIVEMPLVPVGAPTITDMLVRTSLDVAFFALSILAYEYAVAYLKTNSRDKNVH